MLELFVFKMKSSSLLQKLQQEHSAQDSSQPRLAPFTASSAFCEICSQLILMLAHVLTTPASVSGSSQPAHGGSLNLSLSARG